LAGKALNRNEPVRCADVARCLVVPGGFPFSVEKFEHAGHLAHRLALVPELLQLPKEGDAPLLQSNERKGMLFAA